MLGKVQFELQKLVDNYRHHISLTITNPSESLLNELRTVEDMKRQCDEKRNVFDYIVAQQKEKGRSKGGKGETLTSQQLQTAHEEYNEEATLCVFRIKSLKQGQSRSLLTQAARHHAAQLNFFRKGLKSLEVVEPQVRIVTEKQHIDYQFSGLEDDYGEDGENGYDANEDGELSFDYRANEKGFDVTSASRNSMEVDESGITFPVALKMENTELSSSRSHGDLQIISREHRPSSYSEPIFPERSFDPVERVKELLQSSPRKSHTYVLPTPTDSKNTRTSGSVSVSYSRPTKLSGLSHNLWHSSPLEPKNQQFEETASTSAVQLPRPSAQQDVSSASDAKKIKRNSVSTKPVLTSSGSLNSVELPQRPIPLLISSPRALQTGSIPLVSSPRINELHELPRPPSIGTRPVKSPGLVGHSVSVIAASPLPTPPLSVPRSFSIPSSNQRTVSLHVSRLSEPPRISEKEGDAESPPLTPISLANMKPVTTETKVVSESSQTRGD